MYKDFPFDDVVKRASELIKQGASVHQKFTCSGCGQRLTIEEPNIFHTEGTCDKCPAITDIRKQGCNYMVHFPILSTKIGD